MADGKEKKPSIHWSRIEERTLMEICLEKNSTADNGMKPEEWKQTEKEFIKWQTERRRNLQPTGIDYNKSQMQSGFQIQCYRTGS
jgi:hypothetical protein